MILLIFLEILFRISIIYIRLRDFAFFLYFYNCILCKQCFLQHTYICFSIIQCIFYYALLLFLTFHKAYLRCRFLFDCDTLRELFTLFIFSNFHVVSPIFAYLNCLHPSSSQWSGLYPGDILCLGHFTSPEYRLNHWEAEECKKVK